MQSFSDFLFVLINYDSVPAVLIYYFNYKNIWLYVRFKVF